MPSECDDCGHDCNEIHHYTDTAGCDVTSCCSCAGEKPGDSCELCVKREQ